MFLMQLDNIQKFAFLQIAHYLAHTDGEYDNIEEELITEYCIEMGIDDMVYNEEEFNLEQTLALFKSEKSRKILLLELMILIHVDDRFNYFEQNFVKDAAALFGFSDSQIRQASSWGKAMSALREQGMEILKS